MKVGITLSRTAKGFVKRHVRRSGSGYNSNDRFGHAFIKPYERRMLTEMGLLNPSISVAEESKVIMQAFETTEAFMEWRKEAAEKEDERITERQKRRNATEPFVESKIPRFKSYGEPEPTFKISDDGIAKQDR